MSSFQTTTISDIISDLNYSYLLPSIQREFVWDPNQMLDLFDSILRGYPIGSFLLWRVGGDYAENRVKYKFIEDYITEPIHPDELGSVTHHNPRYRDEFNSPPKKINLVLDGQQRLTTLYIGLQGTLTDRGYQRRRDRVDSWTKKQLYLNLLSPQSEEKNGRKYQFQFKQPTPEVTKSEYWYPVRRILEVTDAPDEVEEVMETIENVHGITIEEATEKRKVVSRNLSKLHMRINKAEVIPYFTESEENQEKVLEIFIRTNEGGTQLTKSDILLSIATSHWQTGDEEIVAREEIKKYVDQINSHSVRGGITFSPSFVLRTLLLCSGSPSMVFSLDNFDDSTLADMKQIWMEDEYRAAISTTLDLMTSYGFTTSHVQSKMTLLPVVFFLYNKNPSLSWDSNTGRINRSRILYWLCSMVITGEMNTGGTVQTVQSVRNKISESNQETFPLDEIESTINNYGKSMGLDDETLTRWFQKSSSSLKKSRVFLSLLYFPDIANDQHTYELDHIFPKSEIRLETLIDDYGYSAAEAEAAVELADNVANMQLLNMRENRQKADSPPSDWISSRSDSYMNRHLIPNDESLYNIENFVEFINQRQELIRDELMENTPNRSELIPQID